MTAIRNPMALMKRAALPAVGLLIIANFVGYAVLGDNGVLSWGDYRRAKAERAVQLSQLEAERARLSQRARLLAPNNVDPDLADELVRRDLGLVRPDEVIIEMDGVDSGARPQAASPQPRATSAR